MASSTNLEENLTPTVDLPRAAYTAVPGVDLAVMTTLSPEENVPGPYGVLQTPVAIGRFLVISQFSRRPVLVTLALDRCRRPAVATVALLIGDECLSLKGEPIAAVAALPSADDILNAIGKPVAAVTALSPMEKFPGLGGKMAAKLLCLRTRSLRWIWRQWLLFSRRRYSRTWGRY